MNKYKHPQKHINYRIKQNSPKKIQRIKTQNKTNLRCVCLCKIKLEKSLDQPVKYPQLCCQ